MTAQFSLRAAADWQQFESQWLAPYACRSVGAHATRRVAESEHEYRTAFQRDFKSCRCIIRVFCYIKKNPSIC